MNDSKTNVPYVWSPRAGHVAMVQNRPKGLGEALYVMVRDGEMHTFVVRIR